MKKIFLVIFSFLLLAPVAVSAQWGSAQTKLEQVAKPTGLEGSLDVSIGTIISSALALVGTIFLVLTVYAGILWMTASGSEDKVTKAKNIITAAVIGLVITMAAYAITSFVTGKLGGGGTSIVLTTDCTAASGTCAATCATGQSSIGACGDDATNKTCCK